jgi:hypothetical protein
MTAPQFNVRFREAGLKSRISRGPGYYFWRDELGRLAEGAESVYIARASELTLEHWLGMAREVDTLIRTGRKPSPAAFSRRPKRRWIMVG